MALAIFDLDDTLLAGDSASLWLEFMVQQGQAAPEMLQQEATMMRDYRAGKLAMEQYMAFTLQPLRGVPLQQLAPRVMHFIQQRILPRVYPQGRALLSHYQQQGWRCLIVSATGEHLVAPIARMLGVEESLAIKLDSRDGCYTGATQGVLTYQQGKVQRLKLWCQQQQESLADSHGYSDSINDLPLLSQVSQAHVVNPDPALAQEARARHWPLLQWHLPMDVAQATALAPAGPAA